MHIVSHRTCGSRPPCTRHPIHACAPVRCVVVVSLHPSLLFLFVPLLFFRPFQMSSSEFHERFESNPLCNFRLGTVATSDHETPLTCTSRARSFLGSTQGFVCDGFTRATMSQFRKQAFKFRETMRPKLLVGSPERNTWNQLRNLSKDKELFVVKCTHFSRQRQLRTYAPDKWTTTTISFKNIPRRQFFEHKVFS